MQKLLLLILITILIPIIVEDFKYRKISLIWLTSILITGVLIQMTTDVQFYYIVSNTFVNLCIVAINYGILFLYFSIKNKRIINLGNHYLGIGDLFFLISVSFLFSPLNFICFILFSLFFSLTFSLFAKLILSNKFKTIPLAGLQSLCLILLLTTLLSQNKVPEINNDKFTLSIILTYVNN